MLWVVRSRRELHGRRGFKVCGPLAMIMTPAMSQRTPCAVVVLLLLSGAIGHAQTSDQGAMSVPSLVPQQSAPTVAPSTSAQPSSTPPAAQTPAAASAQPGQQGSDDVRASYDTAFQASLENPSDPDVLAKFAELAVRVGDMEGAISALERLLLIEGDEPNVKRELGGLYFRCVS